MDIGLPWAVKVKKTCIPFKTNGNIVPLGIALVILNKFYVQIWYLVFKYSTDISKFGGQR